jgi:hypothetical protein
MIEIDRNALRHIKTMTERLPLTIEIIGFENGRPVVLDRVIGGSLYLE